MKAVDCNLAYIALFAIILSVICDNERPIYIIGHMTNSIEDVIPFLDLGANALETDIQFYRNGSVKEAYHGCFTPTDCFRICNKRVNLADYLKYLRDITDPTRNNSYCNKFILQFFDLKLGSSKNIEESGRDLARHILDYLWSNGDREQEIRALVYINSVGEQDIIPHFIQEFEDRNQFFRLKDVGFDVGKGNLNSIKNLFEKFNIENIWLGNGIMNCMRQFYSNKRQKEELANRDSDDGFIKKVYDWTIDQKYQMRDSLEVGVDAFITNVPDMLVEVLEEPEYKDKFRVATPQDFPFEKFEG